jgi:tryptophanyl-tRNA synthetase
MARTAPDKSIESQIASYVSGLSDKNKKAVLTVVKTIADADHEAEFEKKWAKGGLTPEQLKQDLLQHVRTFEWKK